MGNARVEFKTLFLLYFLTDQRALSIADYCLRLRKTLEANYSGVTIREDDFVRCFAVPAESESQTLRIPTYRFPVYKDSCEESWEMRFYRTEISHLSGGIKQRSLQDQPVSPLLVRSLISENVADIVVYSKAIQRRSAISSLFQSKSAHDVTLMGSLMGAYLFLKIEAIPSLHKRLRWREVNQNMSWFSSFFASLESVFGNEGKEIVTVPFDQLKLGRAFLSTCDSTILSRITRTDLQEMLIPTGIKIDEWLAAKI